jgi:PhzF family phenazine biosynthesis protein
MQYKYYICDVFTTKRFGGNPLAVLPDAEGLTVVQMQQIAREFNFSESTFVFPPEKGNTRKVRIFTPSTEVPFAGHPNIGTAFVFASAGIIEEFYETTEIVFEEKAGLVMVTLQKLHDGSFWSELQAPEKISIGKTIPTELLASAISLPPDKIITDIHPPQIVSVGLPFLIAELEDKTALEKASVNLEGFNKLAGQGITPDIIIPSTFLTKEELDKKKENQKDKPQFIKEADLLHHFENQSTTPEGEDQAEVKEENKEKSAQDKQAEIKEQIEQDNQLKQALILLKGASIFGSLTPQK